MKRRGARAARDLPGRTVGFFLSAAAAFFALFVLFLAAKNFDRLEGASSLFGYRAATGEAVFLGETFALPARLTDGIAAFFDGALAFDARFFPPFFRTAARQFALFFCGSAREFFTYAGQRLLDFLSIGA